GGSMVAVDTRAGENAVADEACLLLHIDSSSIKSRRKRTGKNCSPMHETGASAKDDEVSGRLRVGRRAPAASASQGIRPKMEYAHDPEISGGSGDNRPKHRVSGTIPT